MTVLSTVRFKLTPARKSSSVELHTLWTSQGVRRFLFDDEVLHYEKTVELLAESERLHRTEGTGLWLITTQEAEDLLGFVGFWYFWQPPELELLYGVDERYWRRGIATETARAMLEHGLGPLQMTNVTASTDFENTASVRVMDRIGMRFSRRAVIEGRDTVFYTASRQIPHQRS